MVVVEDFKTRITELAELMDKFRLSEAELESDGHRIAFRRKSSAPVQVVHAPVAGIPALPTEDSYAAQSADEVPETPAKPSGIPITSPMTGIYYAAPSPNSAPFVKEGDTVTAGQVVGLIEAMKVFNEITATTSGKVLSLAAEDGALVQPGDPLLYIG